MFADKLETVVIGRFTQVGVIESIRQPAKATGPDHLTDNFGNICKVTTTGCHGNFIPLKAAGPSQVFSG